MAHDAAPIALAGSTPGDTGHVCVRPEQSVASSHQRWEKQASRGCTAV